ncbi:MAG: hypothetical protein ACUVRV_01430 [Cyanobacteriota bacterium]
MGFFFSIQGLWPAYGMVGLSRVLGIPVALEARSAAAYQKI